MDVNEKKLRETITEYVDSMAGIIALAEKEERDLTEEEEKEYEELETKAEAEKSKLDKHLKNQERKEALNLRAKTIKGDPDDDDPDVKVGKSGEEEKGAMIENTAKIYRAMCSPSMDAVTRQKNLQEATQKLAEGGHYKGYKYKNAVDAFSTLTDDKGGIFLPTTISEQIMSIAREYGVFPSQALQFPITPGGGRTKIPNYTGDLTFHAANEGNEVASSTFTFKGISLEDRKWMAIVPWTNELDSAAASRLVPIINQKLGEAWAGLLDDAAINADGTASYHNLKGLINRSSDAGAPEVRRTTAANSTLDTIDEDDLINAQLDVAPGIRARGVYVFHPDWNVRLAKIKDSNGLPLFRSGGVISREGDQWFIYGYPVYFSEKMTNTDAVSTAYAIFFVPGMLAFGDAGAFMAEQLTEASIKASDDSTRIYLASQDMKALRVKGFFDFELSELVISSGGNDLGSFTVLETAAS